ncbi:hypothetical protein BD324DRAFT_650870 [Kockovaella imperatae]|uniref:Uncharacterized protein n=1 Tax=Kockovaella imperatae TaxID=4999 RepID=A0A1Y1UJG5_9TREE|nr:hypothetical protein BD324DRAFT_650870 [Kockovaella imperatae]ORX37265.1 hypothetical protein BD324DRAFT_650870 [Kockovaella imperatae]
MSFQDRLANQDAVQLLLAGTSISLVTASVKGGTVWNFPLLLFGLVAHEMPSSTLLTRQFLNLILVSAVFDIFHILSVNFGFSGILNIIVMILKAPIFFTCLNQLRERGGDLQFGPPSFQGLGGASQNWSMPGSFGAGPRSSHQPPSTTTSAPPPGAFPSSGGFRLGGDEDDVEEGGAPQGGQGAGQGGNTQGHTPSGPAPGRNGYQSIA